MSSSPTPQQRTTIYLVRHGETDYNRDGVYQGTLDIPLNSQGRWQALALARRLAHIPFRAVYSSPLIRARETADAIVRALRNKCIYTRQRPRIARGAPRIPYMPPDVIVIPELQELSYGGWQGLSAPERQQADSTLDRLWHNDPWQVQFPDGESLQDVHIRVSHVIEALIAKHRNETILISGHGHVNRIIITHFAHFDRTLFWDIDQPNGCCYKLMIRE